MKKQLISNGLVLSVLLFLAACQVTPPVGGTLMVFAASSLTDAFDEIAGQFKAQHPGVEVALNYQSSSKLAAQLAEGVPADVFASANLKAMQPTIDTKLIIEKPRNFLTNQLVIIAPAANPGQIESLKDLARPGLRLVLAVAGVPIRDYTDQMMAALAKNPAYGDEYRRAVYANLISEEDNVRQVVSKVALGEADAGVVYTSDVTPEMAGKLRQIAIPLEFNVTATYPIARLAASKQPELAQAFIDFVLSPQGQAILAKWGFGPAPAG